MQSKLSEVDEILRSEEVSVPQHLMGDCRLIVLEDEAFEAFESQLVAMPVAENQNLTRLLGRPKRWWQMGER